MDVNKISNRAVEIYSTSNYGIKESIAKAKEEFFKYKNIKFIGGN